MHIWGHFSTITKHRNMVMRLCFKIGLYRQGLLHDLSKYSFTEFWRGCRYFQGNRSPNNYEREVTGVSLSWLHHKGRNRHHFEYWLDYDKNNPGGVVGMIMPRRYISEMFCDRVAACRVYEKGDYSDSSAAEFYYKGLGRYLMNQKTRNELSFLLEMLSVKGEGETLAYIKNEYLKDATIPEDYAECEDLEAFRLRLAELLDKESRRNGV